MMELGKSLSQPSVLFQASTSQSTVFGSETSDGVGELDTDAIPLYKAIVKRPSVIGKYVPYHGHDETGTRRCYAEVGKTGKWCFNDKCDIVSHLA